MDISEKLKQIVAAQLKIEADSIEDSTDIVDDLGADSLDIVEILMVIEEQFGVTIPDEEVEQLITVQDVANEIEKLVK